MDPAPEDPEPVPDMTAAERDLQRIMHKTIRKVTDDFEAFRFNTMIAALMEYNNYLVKAKQTTLSTSPVWDEAVEALVLMLAPSCPHIAEELWQRMGKPYSVHLQQWPAWNEELAKDEVVTIVVQVNGRVRDKIEIDPEAPAEQVQSLALATDGARRHTEGKQVVRVIYAPGRLVNIVVK